MTLRMVRLRPASVACALLLAMAAVGALSRAASASLVARVAGATVAGVLAGAVAGVLRRHAFALGAAFFVGLFTLWAVVALGLRHELSAPGAAFGIAWALAVMITAVRARDA